MLTLSKQTPKRGSTCQTCMVVRTFVIMAILVAAFTIVADDRMQILASVTHACSIGHHFDWTGGLCGEAAGVAAGTGEQS